MKKASKILTLAAVAMAVVALPSAVYATCPGISQPLQHGLGQFFASCPDNAPVDGYAYVLGQEATLNSTATSPQAGADQKIDFVCEAVGALTEQSIDCLPEAGVAGDGNVTVQFDWGGINLTNGTACPNAGGVPGIGRNVIQVVANDGSSVIATVGFSVDFGYYLVEAAHPGDGGLPLACSQNNGLSLVSNTAGLQANTVCLQQTNPPIASDCDAGTAGAILGTCTGGTGTPTVATPGNLYTRSGDCNATPDLRRASWQPAPSTPGPGGSKCVSVTVPPAIPAGQCAFVGGSTLFNDGATAASESGALTGWLRISGNAAASDKVAIKKAELLQGKLRVDFGTENEAAIVGFNVYAGSSKLNSGLIQAKGIGSNDYSFEVGRGALKNERSITIEAVKNDGTTVRSGSVSVK